MPGKSAADSLRTHVGWAFPAQLAWALLSALWNLAGVALMANGLRAPGPTASVIGSVVLVGIAALLVLLIRRWPIAYLLVSIGIGLVALAAVVNAFVQPPALWPSEFWRYAGAILNALGVLAAVGAVTGFLKWKRAR